MREGAGGGSGPREALLPGTGMSMVPVSFTNSQNLRVSWPGSAPRAGGDDIHSNPLPCRGAAWRSGMRPAHLLASPPNAAPPHLPCLPRASHTGALGWRDQFLPRIELLGGDTCAAQHGG